jgi:hypothetical protein
MRRAREGVGEERGGKLKDEVSKMLTMMVQEKATPLPWTSAPLSLSLSIPKNG